MKNMNKFKLLLAGLLMFAAFTTCKKDLPYPIDQVTRGALVDITKAPGTDANIAIAGTPNIAVYLQIVPYAEGDFASLRVSCRYGPNATVTNAYITVAENITSLPATVPISYTALSGAITALGFTPAVGHVFRFYVDVIMPDGREIKGYNPLTGIVNNADFVSYIVDPSRTPATYQSVATYNGI
jgi:hypothetical protein